ncbi:hypothetical protein EB118_06720 [bacterium]|nr:hypothetical protein [bacterium]
MAALSDYLESGILNHIFRNTTFSKPTTISIALTSGVPKDNDTGATIPELPSGIALGQNFVTTNYQRLNLGSPAATGTSIWASVGVDDTTAYSVFSTEVSHSGYFYPLYLSQASAEAADQNGATQSYTFSKTYPGVTFYAPVSIDVSGSQTDPGYPLYEGNGFIKNTTQFLFNTALRDWGWVSGVAILDSATYGSGNLLMYAQLENPRIVYTGDNIKFDSNSLEISLK